MSEGKCFPLCFDDIGDTHLHDSSQFLCCLSDHILCVSHQPAGNTWGRGQGRDGFPQGKAPLVIAFSLSVSTPSAAALLCTLPESGCVFSWSASLGAAGRGAARAAPVHTASHPRELGHQPAGHGTPACVCRMSELKWGKENEGSVDTQDQLEV